MIVETALGRRWPAVGRSPDSWAWEARKRKSIDWAFSELRAMIGVVVVVVGGTDRRVSQSWLLCSQ